MKTKREVQHPVPDEHLRNIGDITVSFAMLESSIQMLVGALIMEHQRIGQIITAELSFSSLRALAISLYIERHGEDEDFNTLRGLIKRASKIEERRNQITHSIWGAGKDKDHITRIKTTAKEKHGLRVRFENVSSDDLAEVAHEIKQLAGEIVGFHRDLIDKGGKALNNPIKKIWP